MAPNCLLHKFITQHYRTKNKKKQVYCLSCLVKNIIRIELIYFSCKIKAQHFLLKYIHILKRSIEKRDKQPTKLRPSHNSAATHTWVATHQRRNSPSIPSCFYFSPLRISSGFPPSSTCCSPLIALLHPKSASLVSPSACRQTAATYQTARGAGTLLKPPLTHPSLPLVSQTVSSRNLPPDGRCCFPWYCGRQSAVSSYLSQFQSNIFPLYQQTLHTNGFKV